VKLRPELETTCALDVAADTTMAGASNAPANNAINDFERRRTPTTRPPEGTNEHYLFALLPSFESWCEIAPELSLSR
jgi:hypothetical protein